jgi:hypothetical protein
MAHLRSRARASAADGALFWVAASEVQALVGADDDEAWQLSEQIIGCLLATVVAPMTGMITRARPPRRDVMNANRRLRQPRDPGGLRPHRLRGDATR